jgi:acyl carrier protein
MVQDEKILFLQIAMKELFNKDIEILPNQTLSDLGLDSLDIVELQMYYEESTNGQITDDSVPVTVADLLAMMR